MKYLTWLRFHSVLRIKVIFIIFKVTMSFFYSVCDSSVSSMSGQCQFKTHRVHILFLVMYARKQILRWNVSFIPLSEQTSITPSSRKSLFKLSARKSCFDKSSLCMLKLRFLEMRQTPYLKQKKYLFFKTARCYSIWFTPLHSLTYSCVCAFKQQVTLLSLRKTFT